MPLDLEYTTQKLLDLLRIPSPTGFADDAIAWMKREVEALGVPTRLTRKGALLWTLGEGDHPARALAAHVDTLGAMVREIKKNGRLRLTMIGGYDWTSVEGEYCTVHAQSGAITGTVVNTKQSTHVFGPEARDVRRDEKTLEVRLDATLNGQAIRTQADARALGVQVGDFVSWDPRATLVNGYIKSRHIDNKAAAAVFLGVTKAVLEDGFRVVAPTHLFISNFEEVGHGASAGIPRDVHELIAVDMAAIGEGQNSSEHHVTLCLKDSSGPYDHQLSNRLRQLAANAGIELRTDTYPYYGSDASAALRAGLEARCALIGPGVDASHAYERTHTDALLATAKLLLEYLTH